MAITAIQARTEIRRRSAQAEISRRATVDGFQGGIATSQGIPIPTEEPGLNLPGPKTPTSSPAPFDPPKQPGLSGLERVVRDLETVNEARKIFAEQGFEKNEIGKRLQVISDIVTSPLFLIPGGETARERVAGAMEIAEKLGGFGPAIVPAAGELGKQAVEVATFQKMFGVTHKAFSALGKTAQMQKVGEAIGKAGGIKQFNAALPRTSQAIKKALQAFTEGGTVGATVGTLEAIDKGETGGDLIRTIGTKAATIGGVASLFSVASSIDNAVYIKSYRNALIDESRLQVKAALNNLPTDNIARGRAIKSLEILKNAQLQKIDADVAKIEAKLIGLKEGKLFKEGQSSIENADVAARRSVQNQFKSLKTGIGKPSAKKPLIPTTRTGEVIESVKGISKAVVSPVKTARAASARDITVKPPSVQPTAVPAAVVAVKPVVEEVKPAKPLEAKQEGVVDLSQTKVVDEKGDPETVFHGTQSTFVDFKKGGPVKGPDSHLGFFFTTSKTQADGYANRKGSTGRVIEANLNLESPLRIDFIKYQGIITKGPESQWEANANEWKQELLAKGHDGIEIFWRNSSDKMFVAFENTQIAQAPTPAAEGEATAKPTLKEQRDAAVAKQTAERKASRDAAIAKAAKPVVIPRSVRKATDAKLQKMITQSKALKDNKAGRAVRSKLAKEFEARDTEKASGVSRGVRKQKITEAEADIKQHHVFEIESESLGLRKRQIDSGFYFVPKKFRSEVYDIIGDPGNKARDFQTKLQKMFTFDATEGGQDWEKAVQDSAFRSGITGIDANHAEMDISEFVQRVKEATESDPLRATIEKLQASEDIEENAIALRWSMWSEGFNQKQIDDEIKNLRDKFEEFKNEQESEAVREGLSEAGETAKGVDRAITKEATAEETSFLDAFLSGEDVEPTRQKDLLGREELDGGASGKQKEFLDKEDFKTVKEKQRINAKKDVAGQQDLFNKKVTGAKNRVQATGQSKTVKISGEEVTINNDEDVPVVENPGHLGSGRQLDKIKVALEPTGKPVPARDIIFQMERDFDVPFRGKITHMMRKSIGHFEIRSKVIRARDVRELSTATHELGHHLDHNFFDLIHKKPPAGSGKELLKLGKDLYGSRKPVGGYKSEGVAEFIRIWLTDNDAKTKAPVFNKWFEGYMKRNPKVGKRLNTTRTLIEKWKAQGAEARINSQITDKPVRGTIKERIREGIIRLETLTLDKFTPLKKLRDEIGASQLHPSEDPFEVATFNANKSGSKAASFAIQGTTDLAGNQTGISLQEALQPVSDDIKTWTTWAVAARARLLHDLGINPGISKTDADFVYEKFKSPEFEKALKEFTAWNHRGLDYMVEAGALEAETAKRIKERHTIYVPFKRAFKEGEIQGTSFGGKGFVETGSPIKKIKGSGRAIKDPISESIKGMEAMISASQKSQVALAMTGLARRFPGMGDKIVKIPAPKVPTTFSTEQIKGDIKRIAIEKFGPDSEEANLARVIDNFDEDITVFTKGFQFTGKENVISIVRDGTREFYEIAPDLFKTLKGLDKFTLPWYLDFWLGTANRALRLGATGINPEFALRNMIRDLTTFGFTSDFAKGNWLSGVKGIGKDIITKTSDVADHFGVLIPKSEDTLLFRALGGEQSSFLLQDKNGIKHIKSTILANSGVEYTINTFLHPIDALRGLVGITESGTRIGEFGPALREGEKRFGKGSVDAAMFALNAAQDVTVNFSRSGSLFQILNQVVPFSNVAVQGPAKLIKTMLKNPLRSVRRSIIGLMLPAIWLWWKNKDKDWWKNLPIHEKTNYLHFENPNNPNEIFRFPVAFELGHAFQTIPVAALDAAYNDDPKKVTASMKFALEQANPIDWPAAVGPIIDVIGNKDFAGRPIVPRSVEGKLPEDQFTPRTTRLMKIIGKTLKMSPSQIEFLVNSYSGGMYGRVARMITSTNQPGKKRDLPVIGTLFMRDPFSPKKQISDFYERAEKLEQKFRSEKITRDEIKERVRFNKSRKQMSLLWKQLQVAESEKQRRKVWDTMGKLIEKTR